MEGFGEKSYQNLVESVEKSRETTLPRVIYSLGIANIGLANAKMICKETSYDADKIMDLTTEELSEISGVGEVIAKAYVDYFLEPSHRQAFLDLLKELRIQKEETEEGSQIFAGVNFVITGNVVHFNNRNEVKELIEKKGGKVTGSVTSKTNYLINNNVASASSKNKKANELGIPIISEEEFLNMLE